MNKANFYLKNTHQLLFIILISFFVFFWNLKVEFIQLRFAFLILLFFIFFKINKTLIKSFSKYFAFSLILILHSYLQSDNLSKYSLYSILVLPLFLIIFKNYQSFFFKNFEKFILFSIVVFFFIYFINLIFFNIYDFNSPCGDCAFNKIFKERSHFAISILPFFGYIFFCNFQKKIFKFTILLLILTISFFNTGVTIVTGFLLILLIEIYLNGLKFKNNLFFVIILCTLTILGLYKFNNKLLSLISVEKNLSSEVYKTSLIIAYNSIKNKPLGYGFNNYEKAFEINIKDVNPYYYETYQLNTKDGSNNFSKLITEFGIFSFLFVYYLMNFFKNKEIDQSIKIFFFIAIFMQIFVRGFGYFNGGFLLFVFYIYELGKLSKKNN